jgi:hypothetical protein
MDDLLPILVQLVSGGVGGNAAASVKKDISLGTAGNSIAGILGGGLGASCWGCWASQRGAIPVRTSGALSAASRVEGSVEEFS